MIKTRVYNKQTQFTNISYTVKGNNLIPNPILCITGKPRQSFIKSMLRWKNQTGASRNLSYSVCIHHPMFPKIQTDNKSNDKRLQGEVFY